MDIQTLAELSDEQLVAISEAADRILQERRLARARETLEEARRLAASVGFDADFTEFGRKKKRKTGSSTRPPVPVKYRHPAYPDRTWTGRGHRPAWLKAALEEGMSLEDLRVSEEPSAEDGSGETDKPATPVET